MKCIKDLSVKNIISIAGVLVLVGGAYFLIDDNFKFKKFQKNYENQIEESIDKSLTPEVKNDVINEINDSWLDYYFKGSSGLQN